MTFRALIACLHFNDLFRSLALIFRDSLLTRFLIACLALLADHLAYVALIRGALQSSLARLCLDYLLSRLFYEGDFEIDLARPKIIMISNYKEFFCKLKFSRIFLEVSPEGNFNFFEQPPQVHQIYKPTSLLTRQR